MAIARVQGPITGGYAGTPATASFPNTPTEGNLMIALGRSVSHTFDNGSIPGWTLAVGTRYSNAGYGGLWYKVAGAAESKDVTITWTSSTGTTIIIEEWTALSATPLDKVNNVNHTGDVTSRSSGTTAETTVADELCIAGFIMNGASSSQTWSNSFSLERNYNNVFFLGSLVVSSTGTYETTLSWTTARYAGGLIATFKGAVAATAWIPKVIMVD